MMYAKVKEIGGEAVKMHGIVHQETLCAKKVNLGDVMNTVVKTVNTISARGLCNRNLTSKSAKMFVPLNVDQLFCR